MTKTKEPQVKSIKQILELLGEQMDAVRPQSKPNGETIQASRASATLVNSYMGTLKLAIYAAKINGEKPDLGFLGITDTKPAQVAA